MTSIKQNLETTRDAFAAWAQKLGASIEIASDPNHAFARLGNKPGSARVVILFSGEEPRTEYEEAGFVDRKIDLIVSHGKGFVDPGKATLETPGRKPIYEIIEEVRQLLRGIHFDDNTSTEVRPSYKGCGMFQMPDGKIVDAYVLSFSIGVQLPAPEDAEDLVAD